METITVLIYRHSDKLQTSVEVSDYSITGAIEQVRHMYNYQILILSAAYTYPDRFIKSL